MVVHTVAASTLIGGQPGSMQTEDNLQCVVDRIEIDPTERPSHCGQQATFDHLRSPSPNDGWPQ